MNSQVLLSMNLLVGDGVTRAVHHLSPWKKLQHPPAWLLHRVSTRNPPNPPRRLAAVADWKSVWLAQFDPWKKEESTAPSWGQGGFPLQIPTPSLLEAKRAQSRKLIPPWTRAVRSSHRRGGLRKSRESPYRWIDTCFHGPLNREWHQIVFVFQKFLMHGRSVSARHGQKTRRTTSSSLGRSSCCPRRSKGPAIV